MPAVHASLTWATPIDVRYLGAHLQTYINTLPIVNTLRLCHRFGKGSHATVSRLPVELIAAIESEILQSERSRVLKIWTAELECFQTRCIEADHLNAEQLEHLKAKLKNDPRRIGGKGEVSDEDLDDHLSTEEGMDLWMPIHHDRSFEWEERVGIKSATDRGFFTQHEDLVKSQFGLEIWIAHVRFIESRYEDSWADGGNSSCESTIAYLKVPKGKSFYDCGPITKDEVDDKLYFIENGYGMGVNLPGPLSTSNLAKFKRTMKILGLEPCPVETAIHRIDRLEVNREDDELPAERMTWPKLTLLIKTTTRSDEPD